MNYLLQFENLANRYFVMRHGQSLANLDGLIASHSDNALEGFGLSTGGRAQVGENLSRARGLDAATRILSSDFRRARESAEIAQARLGCESSIEFETRLRERFFGEFDLGPDREYRRIWEQDQKNAERDWRGVESAAGVMQRVTSLIVDCENRYRGSTLLLVSHGDVLQILQTAFAGEPPERHRDQPHLETAEIRQLRRAPRSR